MDAPEALSSRPAAPPVRRRIVLLLLVAVAALFGALAAFEMQASPFGTVPQIDEEGYIEWARRVAAGDWLGRGVFYQDPLYPYLLAIAFKLTSGSVLGARLLQVALGAATVWVVFSLARRLFGELEAVIAASLAAFYGALAYYQALLLKTTLAIHLAALACLAAVIADEKDRRRDWALAGAMLGLLCLVRGNVLAFAPLALAWAALRPGPGRARRTGWLLAGLLAALAPSAVRNALVGGELVLTTAQAGPNLYIGNNPAADGAYAKLPFVRAGPKWEADDFRAEAERRTGGKLSARGVSQFWTGTTFAWVREHPGDAARLLWLKVRLLLSGFEIPDNYFLPCMREQFLPVLQLAPVGFAWVLGPALAGAAFALRERRARYAILFAGLYALTLVAFFVVSRYRAPLVPILCVFAAHGIVSAVRMLGERAFGKLAVPAALAIAGTAFALAPTPHSRNEPRYLAHCGHLAGLAFLAQENPLRAAEFFGLAVRLDPADIDSRYDLGLALARAGELQGALQAWEDVLRARPQDGDAHLNSGLALARLGRTAEAERHLKSVLSSDPRNEAAARALRELAQSQDRKR